MSLKLICLSESYLDSNVSSDNNNIFVDGNKYTHGGTI